MRVISSDWHKDLPRWLFWIAGFGLPLVWIRGATALPIVGVLTLLVFGVFWLGRPGQVAKTPLSFCLPGFRESSRRRYFGGAALAGLAGALSGLEVSLFSIRPGGMFGGGNLTDVSLHVAGGFFLGMAVALVAGTARLILPRRAWNIVTLLEIPLFLAAIVACFVFLVYPPLGIPVGAAVCVGVWFRLGDMACVKRGHRMIVEDAAEQRREAAARQGTVSWVTSGDVVTLPPWAERLFRGRMKSRPYLSTGRYVWGALYRTFGLWLSYWETILFGLAAAALALGLVGNEVTPGIAVIYFVFAFRVIRLPMASTLLFPGGRREKYYATLATAFAISLLLLAAAVLVVVLARVGVLLVMAAFPQGGEDLSHGTSGLAGILLPFVLTPMTLGIQLMREESRWITSIAWSLLSASLILLLLWPSTWPDRWAVWLLAGMFVFGWVFFLLALRTACRRWDLV